MQPRSRRAPACRNPTAARCHIEDGKEGKDDTPVMASQWLPYMQMQMADYLSGKRKMPEKMKEKVKPHVQGRPGRPAALLRQREIRENMT
jgi:cytochrome c553